MLHIDAYHKTWHQRIKVNTPEKYAFLFIQSKYNSSYHYCPSLFCPQKFEANADLGTPTHNYSALGTFKGLMIKKSIAKEYFGGRTQRSYSKRSWSPGE
jgi:hypothetical protein